MEYDRTRQIDRTKTGVLLLMIGALIGWIPLGISLVGGLLSFIGAILVILGRRAFGAKHSRNVIVAVVVFVLSIVALIVTGILFALAEVSTIISGTPPTAADLSTAVNALLIGGIVSAAIGGIAQVLFTYEIQDQTGRYLLFAGFGATVALEIAIYVILAPTISAAISEALSGGTYNSAPILAIQDQAATYALLAVVADLLWAAAYYMVWSRISKGELPKPLTGPGYPPMPPAYPGMPPQAPPPSGPAPPLNPQ